MKTKKLLKRIIDGRAEKEEEEGQEEATAAIERDVVRNLIGEKNRALLYDCFHKEIKTCDEMKRKKFKK